MTKKISNKPSEVHDFTQRHFPCYKVCEYCNPGNGRMSMAAFKQESNMKAGGVKIAYKTYACSECAIRLGWVSLTLNNVSSYVDEHDTYDIYSDKLLDDPFWNP